MKIIELLYPKKCVFCSSVITQELFSKSAGPDTYLCDECKKKITFVKEPYCKKCGKKINGETKEYCGGCRELKHSFDMGRCVFTYEKDVKNMMYRFKYDDMKYYADFFSECIKETAAEWIKREKFDLVIPVPLYKKKQRIRGYNQAGLIAKKISEEYEIDFSDRAVIRSLATRPQKELGFEDRKNNLKNAFKIEDNSVLLNCRKILIVDDIYTTGATIDSLTEIIRDVVPECRVCFFAVCCGKDF